MKRLPRLALVCISLLWVEGPAATIPEDLAVVEDRSETVANRLLDLSAAFRLGEAAESFFAERTDVTAPPAGGGSPVFYRGGIVLSRFAPSEPRRMSGDEAATVLASYFAWFSSTDDLRFKLKRAVFDKSGAAGTGRVAFFAVGRNQEGGRSWLRAHAKAAFLLGEDKKYRLSRFELEDLSMMRSEEDLFSEVAEEADVALRLPRFGEGRNLDYVWHGAAAGDVDNDGFLDLFVTGAETNRLYRNVRGRQFRDMTEETGLRYVPGGTGALLLDIDNDGDLDIFMAAVGAQMLLENRLVPDGKVIFQDVSLESGVGSAVAVGFSAAAGDVNGDGLPDIYVASYNHYGEVAPDSWFQAKNGTPNLLFVNKGDGLFKEEARKYLVADSRWSYAAVFADLDLDQRQDLYVSNDFGENGLYMNEGETFVDEAKKRGVVDPGNGMGVSLGDFDNDGFLDIHSTNMSSTAGNRILARLFPKASAKKNVLKKLASGNSLFRNHGDGTFTDLTAELGGLSAGWGFGGGFIDFDNDGLEDLYTPNGFVSGKSMKDT